MSRCLSTYGLRILLIFLRPLKWSQHALRKSDHSVMCHMILQRQHWYQCLAGYTDNDKEQNAVCTWLSFCIKCNSLCWLQSVDYDVNCYSGMQCRHVESWLDGASWCIQMVAGLGEQRVYFERPWHRQCTSASMHADAQIAPSDTTSLRLVTSCYKSVLWSFCSLSQCTASARTGSARTGSARTGS